MCGRQGGQSGRLNCHCNLPFLVTCPDLPSSATDSAPDSPLNCDAGNLLRGGDLRGYNSLARMYTLELAQPRAR